MPKTRGFQRQVNKLAHKQAMITPDTLLVGLDLGQKTHAVWVCRSDQTPLDQFTVDHRWEGLEGLLGRTQQLQRQEGLSRVLFAMEPTSHYWMVVVDFLEQHHHPYRVVQPISVWRERQAQDYSFAKADLRDARLIGQLTAPLKFTQLQLPAEEVWRELAQVATEVQDLTDAQGSEQTRMGSLVERIFPDFLAVFAEPTGKTALAVLAWGADPHRVGALEATDFVRQVAPHFQGQCRHRSRVLTVHQHAQQAHRLGGARAASGVAFRLQQAVARYRLYQGQRETAEARLLSLYQALPYARNLDSIDGGSAVLNAQTLAFMGDPKQYDDPRCLPKLAGQQARENESGQSHGQRTITLHGRARLRRSANKAAQVLVRQNTEFAQRYQTLLPRPQAPLDPLQALVACGNKYLRLAHQLCVHDTLYQADRSAQSAVV